MERLPASFRSKLGAVFGVGLALTLLLLARSLDPSGRGYGTHQQLGLPPCSSILLWDTRCPACGMTTSWSYLMRGQLVSAWYANAGGTLLGLIALAYIPAICYYLARGYWSRQGWLSFSLALSLSAALLVAFGQWLSRLI